MALTYILKTQITLFTFLFLNFFFAVALKAQNKGSLSGVVRDTTNVGIPGASVRLIVGKDTLTSTTDTAGKFSFAGFRGDNALLLIRSIGYLSFSKSYLLQEKGTVLLPIVIQSVSQQLNEVVIKAKIVPMRIVKDTLEFNADAYTVRKDDRVEDLLKQLPGIEVDKEGNATSAGKTLTKIRVNGKDFFTGNVKEFISQLPADIVSKIQVVDDFGDKANFTGIKKGEPQKILNLVLKKNKNKGVFSNLKASAGTDDRYSLNLNTNFWRPTKQFGINGDASNTDSGAGISTNTNAGINYRNTLNKHLTVSGNYSYGYNKSERHEQNYIETVNPLGQLFTNSTTANDAHGNTHNFVMDLQSRDGVSFIQGNIRGNVAGTNSNSMLSSMQSGIIRQDLITGSSSSQQSPNLNADFSVARRFKKEGRNLSLGFTLGNNVSDNNDNLDNLIKYYDENGGPSKETDLNRLVDTHNQSRALNTSFTFSEPLNSGKDSTVKKSIDFSYLFSLTRTSNKLETQANDSLGNFGRVDSLSNKYASTFSTHTIGINYRYEGKKLSYSLGFNAQPSLLTGAYEGRSDKIDRSGFNISPVAQASYQISEEKMLNLNYNGNSLAPSLNQLQPVRDTRDLQNVMVGNPDLKTAFNHMLNLNYRAVDIKSGRTLQLGISVTAVQDQVVSNTILIPVMIDSVKTLKQETRYQNTNGNYSLGSNYYWSVPLEKKKYAMELRGMLNYSKQVSYADNQKNFGTGLSLNQALTMRMNQKWLAVTSNVNYNYRSNTYSLAESLPNVVQTWLFDADVKAFIAKSFSVGFVAAKTINKGFSVSASNPLLIRGYVEKTFFKNRIAMLKLEGNDLLNQGNALDRVVSGNSITESRTNQVTRYFLLSFNLRLQSFGS